MHPSSPKYFLYIAYFTCAAYFFTGFTALSYEVLWARMLSTLFGVTTFGVVVTISAFMAGLGVGSLIGGKVCWRINNPLLVLGVIECLIAIFAFNLPTIFSTLETSIDSLSGDVGYGTWIFIQALVTFILMFIPALGLGFGFPLVLKSISGQKIPIGIVYALNTLGGMLGALFPLVLLPTLGWVVSDRLVAVLGFFVAMFIIMLGFLKRKESFSSTKPSKVIFNVNSLLIYGVIGASAIMLEIAWTRLYGMVLLRTEYVMAIILATFLLGIGLGSVLAAYAQRRYWLVVMPIIIFFSAALSLYALPVVSEYVETKTYLSLFAALSEQSLIIAFITLPATLAFGAWLPILVALSKDKNKSGAYYYGANSIGGAIGGIAAGFLIIPFLGTQFVIFIATLSVLIVSIYWVKDRWFKVLPIFAAIILIPSLQMPPISKLMPNLHSASIDLEIYEDALMVNQVVEDENGQRLLMADMQRMDASTEPDAMTVQMNQSRLPLLFHPNPESILFLGLGTGITASSSLVYSDLKRTAVELSEGSIRAAATWFSDSNQHILDHLTLVKDDARRFLKSSNSDFDVIVGDLFHPDLVGRSNLLSIQQFNRAKNRLANDGIFVQWIALNQFDLETLKIVLSTFKKSFEHSFIFVDGFRLALMGVNGEFGGIEAIERNIGQLDVERINEITGGEGSWSWLGRYWGTIPENNWPIQDEWSPIIEFHLPKAKFNHQIELKQLLEFMFKIRSPFEQAKTTLKIKVQDVEKYKAVNQASFLYYRSWLAYFSGQNLESQKLLSIAYDLNINDKWIGFGMADAMFASLNQAVQSGMPRKDALNKIIMIRPDHIGALKVLLDIARQEGDKATAQEFLKRIKHLSPYDKTVE